LGEAAAVGLDPIYDRGVQKLNDCLNRFEGGEVLMFVGISNAPRPDLQAAAKP
jgi:hypothetical protein